MEKAIIELNKENIVKINKNYAYSTIETIKFVKKSSIRSIGPIVKIIHEGKKIGERTLPEALLDLYPNAVYLLSKRTYIVKSLDLISLEAIVEKVSDVDYYTKPLYFIDLLEFKEISNKEVFNLNTIYGEMKLKMILTGFIVYDIYSKKYKERFFKEYEKPIEFIFNTKGFIIKHPILDEFSLDDAIEAFHATEHALISVARAVAGASQTDLSGISYPSGHVIIYDSAFGGSGVAKALFERLEEAYEIAKDILAQCDCEDGCPKYIYSPYCGNNNKMLSRKKSLRLIKSIKKGLIGKSEDIYGTPIV
jgi:DEAD/DEAH box helicase domain-containing protein